MRINLTLLFAIGNIVLLWLHWFIFQSPVAYLWILTFVLHIFLLINFNYKLLIKKQNEKTSD